MSYYSMKFSDRRTFIKQSTVLGMAALFPMPSFANSANKSFKMSLNPGAIGVQVNQKGLLDMAIKYGFEAIVPMLSDLEKSGDKGMGEVRRRMKQHNISWDAAGLPVEFRKDKETFRNDLQQLKKYGPLMKKLNIKGCSTWIMPTHDSLTYLENFKQHGARLKETADVLRGFDVKLGLEYVGPKTLMSLKKHPFVSSMKETRELIAETKADNIGLQLDSFHWFCAQETKEDLLSVSPNEIVTCDLNDAVAGRSVDQQLDYERELPGMSGVIDLKTFLSALTEIGYKGAIRAEPFNAKLNAMDNEQAVALTKKQMEKTLNLNQ